jgi:hypothetical protein
MAKAKKTKKVEEVKVEEVSQQLEPIGQITLNQEKYEECEWCFQFDEDEPQVFAWTDDELNRDEDPKVIFTITNVKDSYITFQNGKTGKIFKIFARELTNEGKDMREKQREAIKNFQKDSQNFEQKIDEYASENKETQA